MIKKFYFHKLVVVFFLFSFFISCPSKVLAVIELTFSTPPSEINDNQEFTIDVTLSGVNEGAEYYVRGSFYQETGKYFGFTKNNSGELHTRSSNYDKFYKIQGNQTVPISFKPDHTHANFKGTSNYTFKLQRITTGGSESWHDQTAQILINTTSTPVNTSTPTTPTFDTSKIKLSEIFPCPSGDNKEWVEIHNQNDQVVNLENWEIRDDTASNKQSFSVQLNSQQFYAVEINSSFLNNSGDSVKLLDPQGNVVGSMNYSTCSDQTSLIWHDGEWRQTTNITKNSGNSFTAVPTATSQSTATPKPTSTPKPTATVKASNTATSAPNSSPSLSSSLDEEDTSTFSASLSGLVLGTSDEPNTPTPTKQAEQETTNKSNSKTPALLSLLFGGIVLSGISGYGIWDWYKKHKTSDI